MTDGNSLRMGCIVDGTKGRRADSIHAGLGGSRHPEMTKSEKLELYKCERWELTEDGIRGGWCEREVGGWTWTAYMLARGGS